MVPLSAWCVLVNDELDDELRLIAGGKIYQKALESQSISRLKDD